MKFLKWTAAILLAIISLLVATRQMWMLLALAHEDKEGKR